MRTVICLLGFLAGSILSCADDAAAPEEPIEHRAEAIACNRNRAVNPYAVFPASTAPECIVDSDCADLTCDGAACLTGCIADPDGGVSRCAAVTGECLRDSECTEGENGRCDNSSIGYLCTYDTCFADSECTTGGPCACEEPIGLAANICLPGNCKTDADCDGGFCSPTVGDCGNNSRVVGYFCHTETDTCSNDAECFSEEAGGGYCMYQSDVGHWQCGYTLCAG